MITPEQAQHRLAEWRLPKGQDRLKDEVAHLDPELRGVAEELLGLRIPENESPYATNRARRQRVQRSVSFLDSQSTQTRAKVFSIISPQLASVMESTWQLIKTLPYSVGYHQKPFRVPGQAPLVADHHDSWLRGMAAHCGPFPAELLTLPWIATWGSYLNWGLYPARQPIGLMLAAAINGKGEMADDVFEILRQSLTNQHEIGSPGSHIYSAFLYSSREEAWELMEGTLLAAQRQEGLRQAILESVDLGHPDAFRRMLRLILDHDLIRFSSVVRAFDVWMSHQWSATSAGAVRDMLTLVVEYLDDPHAREEALGKSDASTVYLALWCAGTEDALGSCEKAEQLLSNQSAEIRYVAVRHLLNLGLSRSVAAVLPAIDDSDRRVATLAVTGVDAFGKDDPVFAGCFERVERLLARFPMKQEKLESIVWPWTELTVDRIALAARLIKGLGSSSPSRLIPYLSALAPYDRGEAVKLLAKCDPWSPEIRDAILKLVGDAAEHVRDLSVEAISQRGLSDDDALIAEGFLTRKTASLRTNVLKLLLQQKDDRALSSGRRLVESKNANQRLAGLELLRHLSEANRGRQLCRQIAAAYRSTAKTIAKEEQSHLDEIGNDNQIVTLDDAFGLMNPNDRTPVTWPKKGDVPFITPAAVACIESLDEFVHQHRGDTVKLEYPNGNSHEELLGTIEYRFPTPRYFEGEKNQQPPLVELWLEWSDSRGKELRDDDGLELLRASIQLSLPRAWRFDGWKEWGSSDPANSLISTKMFGNHQQPRLRYDRVVQSVIEWLQYLRPSDGREYLLNAIESAFALVPKEDHSKLTEPSKHQQINGVVYVNMDDNKDWRDLAGFHVWIQSLRAHLTQTKQELNPSQIARYWRLMHWHDQPVPNARRKRIDVDLLLKSYDLGEASLADLTDHLLGPRGDGHFRSEGFALLAALTAKKKSKEIEAWLRGHQEVQNLLDRAIERLLDLELHRGDTPTVATPVVVYIDALWGIETLRRILHSLGNTDFKLKSGWNDSGDSRSQILTLLAKRTYPAPAENTDDFKRIMKAAVSAKEFPEERLLQLVFLSPQWVKHIEAYFGWDQMSEGVYWFLAHMRYVSGQGDNAAEASIDSKSEETTASNDSADDPEAGSESKESTPKLSAWQKLIRERTPLTDLERSEGAVDTSWFQRTYDCLGPKRWQALASAARFASNSSQAKRAQFIADVLLNKVKRKDLVTGIKDKQLKENVRLLGLLPLAAGKKRQADLIERVRVLREYHRYANQLSGLTKPAALRAWEIGMKNLAILAGFTDPLRLEWALGAENVKDLGSGGVEATKDGVTVSLILDEFAKPELTIRKGEKELKSIPPAIKKDKTILAITSRVIDLKRQATAIKQSLESAMCRGDVFTGEELVHWHNHTQLVPLLSRLVVIGEGILGYPANAGKTLRDFEGRLEPVKPDEQLRFAHSCDLLKTDTWHEWQRECFQTERVQPFKQIFRELYVVTKQEKKDGPISRRYAGHQIQPNQALALFGTRGWDTRDGICKVFHDVELTASVYFKNGIFTPAEVECPTIEGVSFSRRDDPWNPIPLDNVPPRLFSEVMRDLDLVVSVAHAGGVDPEASASTVEMRAELVRETCTLLQLKNVRIKSPHLIIVGKLAEYSLHLGSGVVHKMPGGSLCIVPVHAQHRGRLFLPFADDDPTTAEVLAKTLLLARDEEIKDPSILDQIRR